MGIGKNGTVGGNNAGDIFLAFSTANEMRPMHTQPSELNMTFLNDQYCDPVYPAAIQSVEEAVVNAMIAAEDMGGTQWPDAP